jgi:YD repeat-containing protein
LIGIGAAEYVTGNNTCSYDLGSGGFGSSCTNDINEVVNTATYFSQPYTQNSGIYLQTKAYETTYENGTPTKFVRNTTETTYTTNTQAKTTKVTKGSSLEQTVTVNTYPYELTPNGSSTGSAKGVYLLNTKHILTNPIETFSYLQGANGTNQRIISGQVVTFKENATSTGKVVADSIYLLEGSLPFVKSAYTPVSISGNNSWIVKNSNYKARLKLNNYDSDGNLLTLAKINDISTSYLYGYANSVPIAKITNATLTEYLHENFEELAPSGTIINSPTAHTGKQYYNGDYTVNFTKPNGRTYTVDYWYYDTKWNYISKTFTGTSMSLTEGTRIDNVRIYPSDAQMTTYTYDILNGMTSMADTNGRVEYYEYDPFGRLLLTRDSDGNITKAYKYHYREE